MTGEVRVNIKPLSVNECWQGKRFKTDQYKVYEKTLLWTLPKIVLPPPPYRIYLTWGVSNVAADWDNPVKPTQDILQKKYGFNDRDVWQAIVTKKLVTKGKEFFSFFIEKYLFL